MKKMLFKTTNKCLYFYLCGKQFIVTLRRNYCMYKNDNWTIIVQGLFVNRQLTNVLVFKVECGDA